MAPDAIIEAELGLPEVLTTAEEIENRRFHRYLRLAAQSEDSELRCLCHRLTTWSRRRADALAHRRVCAGWSEEAAARPRRLAALAFFAANDSVPDRARATMTKTRLLRDEIDRSRCAVVFYQGLKEFTRDETAHKVIDEIIGAECDCLGEMISVQAGTAQNAGNTKGQ